MAIYHKEKNKMDNITLYHYSNLNFKGYIKPDFFGLNFYSGYSKKLSGIKRSYFYLNKYNQEYYFNGAKYCYIAGINRKKLYNLIDDKKNIVKNLKSGQDIYKEVKKIGYSGLIGSNGLSCIVLFYPVKIKERNTLTK